MSDEKISLCFLPAPTSMHECSYPDSWKYQQKCEFAQKNSYVDKCRFVRFDAFCQSEDAQAVCSRQCQVPKEEIPEDLNRGVNPERILDRPVFEDTAKEIYEREGDMGYVVVKNPPDIETKNYPWKVWVKKEDHGPDLGPLGHWNRQDDLDKFMRKLKNKIVVAISKTRGFQLKNMWWGPNNLTDHYMIDMVYSGPGGVCGQASYAMPAIDFMRMRNDSDDHLMDLGLRIADGIISQYQLDRSAWIANGERVSDDNTEY